MPLPLYSWVFASKRSFLLEKEVHQWLPASALGCHRSFAPTVTDLPLQCDSLWEVYWKWVAKASLLCHTASYLSFLGFMLWNNIDPRVIPHNATPAAPTPRNQGCPDREHLPTSFVVSWKKENTRGDLCHPSWALKVASVPGEWEGNILFNDVFWMPLPLQTNKYAFYTIPLITSV